MAWDGVRGALYRELRLFARRAGKQVPASLVSPLLFLVAFSLAGEEGAEQEHGEACEARTSTSP